MDAVAELVVGLELYPRVSYANFAGNTPQRRLRFPAL